MDSGHVVWECMGQMSGRTAEVAEVAAAVMDQLGVAELSDNVAFETHCRLYTWDGETDQDRIDCIRKILERVSFTWVD